MASPSFDLSPLWTKLDAAFGHGGAADLLQTTLKSINQKLSQSSTPILPSTGNLRRNDALDEAMGVAPPKAVPAAGTHPDLSPLFNQFVTTFSNIGDRLTAFAGGNSKPPGSAGLGGGGLPASATTGAMGPNCCDDLAKILGSIDDHIEVLIYEARVAKHFQWGGGGTGLGIPTPPKLKPGEQEVKEETRPVQMGDFWKSRKKGFWGGASALANEANLGINRLLNPEDMSERGKEVEERGKYMRVRGQKGGAFKEFQGRAVQAGSSLIQGFGEGTSTSAAKGVLGAVGAIGGMIPVIGPALKGVTSIGTGLLDATEKLNKWSNQLHESNMRFAEFSGSMATVQAESQIRNIQMNKIQGDATAESARGLAEAKDRARKAGLAWEVRWQKTGNFLAKTWEEMKEFTNNLIEAVTPGNPLEPEDKDNLDAYDWLQQEVHKNWTEVHGLPGRWDNGAGGGGAWG